MYRKLVGRNRSLYIFPEQGRWLIAAEVWGSVVLEYVLNPYSDVRVQHTKNGVRFIYTDKKEYRLECTLREVPDWVEYMVTTNYDLI